MVSVDIAILGDGVATKEFDEGTTLGQIREILALNPTLSFTVSGDDVDDDYVVRNNDTLIAAKDVKGGIA
jgi:hypothetical protein